MQNTSKSSLYFGPMTTSSAAPPLEVVPFPFGERSNGPESHLQLAAQRVVDPAQGGTILVLTTGIWSGHILTTNCGNRCRANQAAREAARWSSRRLTRRASRLGTGGSQLICPDRCPLRGLNFYEEEPGTGSRFCGPWRKTALQARVQDRPAAQTRSRFAIRASSPSGRMADGAIAPARSVSISGSFCSFQYPAAGGSAHWPQEKTVTWRCVSPKPPWAYWIPRKSSSLPRSPADLCP